MSPVKLLFLGSLTGALGLASLVLSPLVFATQLNVQDLAFSNLAEVLQVNTETQSAPNVTVGSTTSGTISSTLMMSGSNKVATAITNFFSGTISATQVISLHQSGWGYGEIFKLYLLAQRSGKSVDAIMKMRDDHMGWGIITKALELFPGNKGTNLGAAVSGRGISATLTTTTTVPSGGKGHNPHSNSSPPGKNK